MVNLGAALDAAGAQMTDVVKTTIYVASGEREELVAAYRSGSPLVLENVAYYSALAEWKWAAIDVGIHRRYAGGQMGDASIDLDAVTGEIDSRLHRARALLAGAIAA